MSIKKRVQNPILFELLIVVLFFALSACLLLRLFSGAYLEGKRAEADGAALNWAEDLAERYFVSEGDAHAFLTGDGWTLLGGEYARTEMYSGREYAFRAQVTLDEYNAGAVSAFTLTAVSEERVVFTLPAAKYIRAERAGEVASP